jgi:hypothetical protein
VLEASREERRQNLMQKRVLRAPELACWLDVDSRRAVIGMSGRFCGGVQGRESLGAASLNLDLLAFSHYCANVFDDVQEKLCTRPLVGSTLQASPCLIACSWRSGS